MNSTIRFLTITGCALTFLLSYNMLEVVGWSSLRPTVALTKIHPSVYLLFIAALLGLGSGDAQYWNRLRQPRTFLFLAAAIVMVVRGVTIVSDGATGGGEFSATMVTWLCPALLLIALPSLNTQILEKLGTCLRVFFVVNSAMGLLERLMSTHFVPTLIEGSIDIRASAMLGHPLNASMLTGMMIIHLVTARASRVPVYLRIPELVLHGVAMFAFGGRSALVTTVAVVLFSSIIARRKRDERDLSALQRALPYLVLLFGVILILAPLPFVDATLDRFTNDDKSSLSRNAAFSMIAFLDPQELLMGVDFSRRQILQEFFETPFGIEIAWISLTMTYGLVTTLPTAFALYFMIFRTTSELDRSAFYMAVAFTITTATSLSIGSKSLLIIQTLIMMTTLAQRRIINDQGLPRAGRRNSSNTDRPARRVPTRNVDEGDVPTFLR